MRTSSKKLLSAALPVSYQNRLARGLCCKGSILCLPAKSPPPADVFRQTSWPVSDLPSAVQHVRFWVMNRRRGPAAATAEVANPVEAAALGTELSYRVLRPVP